MHTSLQYYSHLKCIELIISSIIAINLYLFFYNRTSVLTHFDFMCGSFVFFLHGLRGTRPHNIKMFWVFLVSSQTHRRCSTRGHCSVSLALTSDWTLKRRVLTLIKTVGSAVNLTLPFCVLNPKTGTGIWCFCIYRDSACRYVMFSLKDRINTRTV